MPGLLELTTHDVQLLAQRRDALGAPCRVLGGSRFPWLNSFIKYFVSTGAAGVVSWYVHPYLLDAAAELLNLNYNVCLNP